MKISLDLPKKIGVEDYLKQLGLKVRVKEIAHDGEHYTGIVYTGALTDKANAVLIRDLKEEERIYEEALYSGDAWQ